MPISEQKRLERRQAVLQCARDLMAELPYEAITMRILAESAGVTPPTLYNTFTNREALLVEAMAEDVFKLTEAVTDAQVRGLDRILHFLTLSANLLVDRRAYAETILKVPSTELTPIALQMGQRIYMEILSVFTTGIEEMRAIGEIEDWIETDPLAIRLASVQRGVRADWVAEIVTTERVVDATVFPIAAMLAAVTRGETRERCRGIIRDLQPGLREPLPQSPFPA